MITKPPPTRKRRADSTNWIKNIIKKARAGGSAYVNHSGKLVKAKEMLQPCNCSNKCANFITEEQRKTFFDAYYALTDNTLKWQFICNHVKYTEKKTSKVVKNSSRNIRSANHKYTLPVENPGEFIFVCRQMFINTLAISKQTLLTAFSKNSSPSHDQRGRYVRKINIVTQQKKQLIVDHIKSFPVVDSHFLREQTTKKYLEEGLSIKKMHEMYVDYVKSINSGETFILKMTATERQYRDIFNTEFNLCFFTPKKDQCDACTSYQMLSIDEQALKSEAYELHIKSKDLARKQKDTMKNEAQISNGSTIAAVFDFQKTLICPRGESSSFYYKRKLGVHNFTVYNMNYLTGYCYMWDDSLTGTGSCEVTSCLYQFMQSNKTAKKFYFFSDNCQGQNKNRIVYAFYNWYASKFNVSINHTFLVTGHTQNEADSVHSRIEKSVKKQLIYEPNQYYDVTRKACKKNPYNVIEMQLNEFKNFKVH